MKKSLLLSFGVVGLAAASLALAPSLANAQGANGRGYQNSLDRKAKVLGIDAEKLKTQLKTKSLFDIAKDKGMSKEQFQQKMAQSAEARWKERGFSQTEIDKRKKAMKERHANCDGTGNGGGMRYHRGGANR